MFSETPSGATASPLWSDLPDDLLASYGLTQDDIGAMSNGYPDHTWRPGKYVTRGQFVRFVLSCVWIFPGYPGNVYQRFTDVSRDDPVTREQAVTILMGYLSQTEPSTFDYSAYTVERVNQLRAPFAHKHQVRRPQEVAMALDRPSTRGLRRSLCPWRKSTKMR